MIGHNPSLNISKLRKEKNNSLSNSFNMPNRNKKLLTLQNNLNFNDLIYSNYKKHKKNYFCK